MVTVAFPLLPDVVAVAVLNDFVRVVARSSFFSRSAAKAALASRAMVVVRMGGLSFIMGLWFQNISRATGMISERGSWRRNVERPSSPA